MFYLEWDPIYLTNFDDIDVQHAGLMSFINNFYDNICYEGSIDDIKNALSELGRHVAEHFSYEEKFMQASGIDIRHLEYHQALHESFLAETKLKKVGTTVDREELRLFVRHLGYRTIYHMLAADSVMAQQIKLILQGESSTAAYEKVAVYSHNLTSKLFAVLESMEGQIVEKNQQLLREKEFLEQQVEERTRMLNELVLDLKNKTNESKQLCIALLRANRKLRSQVGTDALTGLPNRRHAIDQTRRIWSESIRCNFPMACIFLDVDGFKLINDIYGHSAGDKVLRHIALKLRTAIRISDYAYRYAGDEFVIICLQNAEGAKILANHVQQVISEEGIELNGQIIHASVSIGVYERNQSMSTVDALIDAADAQLYLAKNRRCAGSTVPHTDSEDASS